MFRGYDPNDSSPAGPESRAVVFIGDDEPMLNVVILSIQLRWPDVSPVVATLAEEGLSAVEKLSPDVVIIAADQAGMSPGTLVEELRSFSAVPILVLSRSESELQAVTCLAGGADDYIRFPCGIMEIMARMWASLRRAGLVNPRNGCPQPTVSGDLLINPATYEVFLSNRRVPLTATEFRLLHLLAQSRGNVVSHRYLEQTLWGDRGVQAQVAKKYIQRLRSKLGDRADHPTWIASVPGVGYRFIGPKPTPQKPQP